MAVELLVNGVTNLQFSGLDRRHFWAQGEVVMAKQSPAVWGRELDPDKPGRMPKTFWIITVEDINMGHPFVAEWLEEGLDDPATEYEGAEGVLKYIPFSRRRYWFDVALLPQRMQNSLRTTRRLSVPTRDFASFIDARQERVAERTDDVERQL